MNNKKIKKKKRIEQQKRNIERKKQIETTIEKKQKRKVRIKDKEKVKKKCPKAKIAIFLCVVIALTIVVIYFIYRPKFKNLTIELGTDRVTVQDFLVSDMYAENAVEVTDLNAIDLQRCQEIDVILKYKEKEEFVKLSIVDTTAPIVEFKDMNAYLDYEINPEDFVESKEDLSEMTIKILNEVVITDCAEYPVVIEVSDVYGNKTGGICTLIISWLINNVYVELGDEVSIEDIVIDSERFGNLIEQSEIDKIDTNVPGVYEIQAVQNERVYKTTVTVQDTTPPELELKNISIWNNQKIGSYRDFIVSASDISGEPKIDCKSNIDYNKLGEHEIVITATDINGNVREETAILTIRKDTTGPVIYGLSNLTVAKHSEINYVSSVYARDEKDGNCEVNVDSSEVDVSSAGTYFATYTSVDLSGNTTVSKRKIIVNHDQEDTNEKINEFYYNYCAGLDAVGISMQVREKISYNSNWGGNDPIWYGLTNWSGNCFVHASILHSLLNKAGYSNQLIWLRDKSHYWNLVNVGGVWWHLDGTPSVNHTPGLLTDEQKLADPGVHNKTWDREAWPSAG